jgi:Zn-dependent protease
MDNKKIFWAIATVAIYSFVFHSIWPALLLAGAISWHECCHLMAAKKMGLQTRGFTLYPFIGGVAVVGERYRSYGQQAFVVLAGPFGGGVGAVLTGAVFLGLHHWFHLNVGWLCATAYWMAFLNLFNLLPLSFMDGGQLMDTVTYSMSRTLGVVCQVISTIIACALLLMINPILGIFIVLFGGMQVYGEVKNLINWKQGTRWLCNDYWNNPPKSLNLMQGAATVVGWILTTVMLTALMIVLHKVNADASTLGYFFR